MATTMAGAHGTGTQWKIDTDHTHVGFAVKHMMLTTVNGQFSRLSGDVAIDEADLTASRVRVSVDTASVDTRNEARDAHLRSADFFAVDEYPAMEFESRRIERVDDDRYRIVGDLTIRGVTREVTVLARQEGAGVDPWGQQRLGFSAEARINRTDFGLTWNQALEAGGVLVSNEVRITLELQLIAV